MPFTPDQTLLVTSNSLQEYLVDGNGNPLSNGTISFYHDNARTIFKNIYTISGSPGSYTYVALPNPLSVGGNGTIVDGSVNEVNIFYYPVSETNSALSDPYYITINDSNGVRIKTLQNFPFVASSGGSSTVSIPTKKNLLSNSGFYHSGWGSPTVSTDLTNVLNQTICPGAHEQFTWPDYQFFKNVIGAVDSITFTEFDGNTFLQGNSNQNVTPQYYLNFVCSTAGIETTKYIQIPIQSKVKVLTQTKAIFNLWTINNSGSPNNTISINLYQFMGSGASSPTPTLIGTINPSTSWQLSQFMFEFPSLPSSPSQVGDDGWYLQINFPVGAVFNMSITKPSIYIGANPDTDVPNNDFDTYDQVNTIISSPRSGDIRTSVNSFAPFGWVPMNDGTIGTSSSGATTRAANDTFQLYKTLYLNVANAYAPVTGGRTAPGNTLAACITDYLANKSIALTKTLGRALASVGTPSSGTNTGTNWALGQTTGNEVHTLALSEIPQHTHDSPPGFSFFVQGGSGDTINVGSSSTTSTLTGGISTYTSQTALNMQTPMSYLNVFIKL